jgi:hypothetical protein
VAPAPKLALPIVITVLVFLDGHDERGSYGLWPMAYGLWPMAYGLWPMAYGEALNKIRVDAFGVIR